MKDWKDSDPEYRFDEIAGRWVVVAPERSRRPESRSPEPRLCTSLADCPFCEGKESSTPSETFVVRSAEPTIDQANANTPGWLVRFLPNLYPAVHDFRKKGLDTCGADGWYGPPEDENHRRPGLGRHEVVVLTPRHHSLLTEESVEHAEIVFLAYRDRLRALRAEGEYRAVHLFHNSGRGGGASQEHLHSQLIATPFVPEALETELAGARAFAEKFHRDPWSVLREKETACGERLVAETEHLTAWCPFASRFAFEIWVAPKLAGPWFDAAGDAVVRDLGRLMHQLLGRIENLVGPAYNYYLHAAPWAGDHSSFCWHWEITPRHSGIAGWEVGTNMYLNPTPPEQAASMLRGDA